MSPPFLLTGTIVHPPNSCANCAKISYIFAFKSFGVQAMYRENFGTWECGGPVVCTCV